MKILLTLFLTISIIAIFSCKKSEGPGGTSNIIGKVWVEDYSKDFTLLESEYWAEEENVYILYGNDTIFSDRTKTTYNGSYWFQYLHEGTYTIYVFSNDSSTVDPSPSGRIPVKVKVTIDKSGVDYIAPQITILN